MSSYNKQKFKQFKELYFQLLTRKNKKIIVIITESSNATYILSSLQNTFLWNGVMT